MKEERYQEELNELSHKCQVLEKNNETLTHKLNQRLDTQEKKG